MDDDGSLKGLCNCFSVPIVYWQRQQTLMQSVTFRANYKHLSRNLSRRSLASGTHGDRENDLESVVSGVPTSF